MTGSQQSIFTHPVIERLKDIGLGVQTVAKAPSMPLILDFTKQMAVTLYKNVPDLPRQQLEDTTHTIDMLEDALIALAHKKPLRPDQMEDFPNLPQQIRDIVIPTFREINNSKLTGPASAEEAARERQVIAKAHDYAAYFKDTILPLLEEPYKEGTTVFAEALTQLSRQNMNRRESHLVLDKPPAQAFVRGKTGTGLGRMVNLKDFLIPAGMTPKDAFKDLPPNLSLDGGMLESYLDKRHEPDLTENLLWRVYKRDGREGVSSFVDGLLQRYKDNYAPKK